MHSTQFLAIVTAVLTTTASAYPKRDAYSTSVEQAQNQCGDEQSLACCNSQNLNGTDGNSLLGALGLDQLLGGNCDAITVPVLAVPINHPQACGSNVAACCQKNSQTGAINVNAQCSPVDIL